MRVLVQVASDGGVVDDSTIQWPAQRQIIFDPIPRVDGIEPSGDPAPHVFVVTDRLGPRDARDKKGDPYRPKNRQKAEAA